MLRLVGSSPSSGPSLEAALAAGLAELLDPPDREGLVTVEGDWPRLDRIAIDLGGATIRPKKFASKQPAMGGGPRVTVQDVRVESRPLHYEGSRIDAAIEASGAVFRLADDWLILEDADAGQVFAQIAHADIENLLLQGARAAPRPRASRSSEPNSRCPKPARATSVSICE